MKTKNIAKKIKDLTLHDLSVIKCPPISWIYHIDTKNNRTFTFTFESLPTLSQQHSLEIVFVSDEGEEFRFNVDVDFSQVAAEVEEK